MTRAAYRVELLKLRRSRVPAVAAVVVLLAPPLLAWAFMTAGTRGQGDPLSAKVNALSFGEGWSGYLNGLTQIAATGGFVGIGIVATWCFGREFADRQVVSLYASATSRRDVAGAKLMILIGWSLVVAIMSAPAALGIGLLAGLGNPDASTWVSLLRLVALHTLTGSLALTAGLFASAGRGYLAGFAGLIGLVVTPQLAIAVGAGSWFPWSAPGLWAIAPLNPGFPLVPGWHLLLVPLAALVTAGLTVAWWETAELR
ncbi:ABC-2 type transport system permease protein [Pedococcus dokdonensis]|uniref:ABC-2 type transport system permease protein n=1 Tax=Pedococcus dokdonensis TaxID=443156 RepID=A0A1H0SHW5_9MICO|nr:ABC transporter permease [Pedococcus dokdonensis]SDP40818.1 ABC-2 type transport system permease protein [Pedococcus dokdonensis]